MSQAITHEYIRNSYWFERLVARKSFWFVFCTIAFSWPIIRSLNRELPPELPVISTVGQFELIDQYGKAYGTNDLQGKVWIATTIQNDCEQKCLDKRKEIQNIQHRIRGLGTKAALVTISINPEIQKSQQLKDIADTYHANPHVWKLMTGTIAEVQNAVNELRFPLMKELIEFKDNEWLVLVDQSGRIRGHYKMTKDEINRLMIDVGLVINRHKFSKEFQQQGS